jgi:transglutaminase-like putative cysteine protease
VFWATGTNPVTAFNSLIEWCSTYDWSDELYVAGYANIIVFSTAVLSSILFYLFTIKQLTKILLGIVLFTVLIVLSVYDLDINKVVVAICFLYILTIIVEQYGKFYTRRARRPEKREGILYLVPVCLLLAVLSVSFPSRPEPIQWKLFKTIYNKVSEQIETWKIELDYLLSSSGSEFSINMTGYSENSGKLNTSGKLVNDDKVTLKMSGLRKDDSVYLIGSVSDTYTGSSWEKNKSDSLTGYDDYFLDYTELFYAMSRLEPEVIKENRFLEWNSTKILYNKIKTKTFFYPGKMSAYSFYSSYDKIDSESPQINFRKARGKGTSYQAIYYDMNLKGEAFIQMLKDADSFSYNNPKYINNITAKYIQLNTLRQDKAKDLLDYDYYEVLKARSEIINARYTGLPDELPDRVYKLADTITEGYDTKYEKLKAIEAYLLNNYTYSRRSPRVPEGQDYIDYFLFEGKAGYCTSFATAMAVLGRSIGIPTRYVEGYIARFEDMDEDNMYLIKNSYAHAWAEAYIEGVGWIPFEATAPYHDVRYTDWKDDDFKYETSDDYLERYNAQNIPQVTPPVINKEDDKKESFWEAFSGVVALIIILSVLLAAIAIYYNVLRYRYKRDFEKSDYNDKTYMLFLRILRQLKKEGFVMSSQETVIMLAERVKDIFRYEGVSFSEIAQIYMRYRYANEEITRREYEQVAAYQLGLAAKYKNENNKLKVWLEELIFLSMDKRRS